VTNMTREELNICIEEADEQGDLTLRDYLMDIRTALEADEYAKEVDSE
jgi:hypothetical protein